MIMRHKGGPMNFKTGDKVMLKSGGPEMTVAFQPSNQACLDTGVEWGVHCRWFGNNSQLHRAIFHPDELQETENHTSASCRI